MIGGQLALIDKELRCTECDFPLKVFEHPIIKKDGTRQIFFVQPCKNCIGNKTLDWFEEGYSNGYQEGKEDSCIERCNNCEAEFLERDSENENRIKQLMEQLYAYSLVINELRSNGHKEIVEKMCKEYVVPYG